MNRLALLAALIAGSASAEVPIQIAPSGHATVPVEGSFGVMQFVFDTGAEGSAVYADFADEAGLKPAGSEQLQGQTGTADVQLVRLERLALDGASKASLDAVKLDPRADGVSLAGIVGLDLFGAQAVDFNLPAMRLALLSSGMRPIAGEGIPATPTAGNLLTIPVTIGSVTAVAVIDTGARKTRINWKLGGLLGLDASKVAKGETIQGATNTAVETGATRVSNVRLGDRVLADASVLVADLPVFEAFGVADKPAIILGLDWLNQTRMVIDFPARLVWFEAATRQ